MKQTLKLQNAFHLFKRKKKLIILVTFFMTFIGGFTSFAIPLSYEAKADVIVKLAKEESVMNVEGEKDLLLTETYKHLTNNDGVLSKVNVALNTTYKKEELKRKVKVESKLSPQTITIIAKDKSPDHAIKLANTLAIVFQDESKTSKKVDNVLIISDATVEDEKPITPLTVLFFAFSALVGCLLSYVIVLIQQSFLTILDSPEKAEKILKLPVLGVLPFSDGLLINELPANHVFLEAFQSIQKNLTDDLLKKQAKTLLVSSAESGDGKLFVSTNLSVAFAMDHKKTVYVDVDLCRATEHRLFEYSNQIGVTSYVLDLCSVNDIIQPTKVPNLFFISAGPVQTNPSELLSTENFVQLLEELRQLFDVIIVDTHPLTFAETLKVTNLVDGCIYVVNAETSRVEKTIHAIEKLKIVQAPLLGVIINKSKDSPRSKK
ncbi:polysaccharide biosynthesis tyrosine autokinase [Paenisporosarcina indica]|uniref:polysaccharide biosynthesis tyrosine autokinase n=1 Tax=Paenisporosarcina indica TaxID=650093 RepID=UPI00094FA376|nr:polysaccharide biosynthesis tyrosine autokinase [Paenisporosarcina indica]